MGRKEDGAREKIRIRYYECNMTKGQHLAAYLVFAAAIGVILFIYYRFLPVAVVGGLLIAVPQEKNYAKSVMRKRQRGSAFSLRNSWRLFPSPSAAAAAVPWRTRWRTLCGSCG